MTIEEYLKKSKKTENKTTSYRDSLIKRTLLTITICLALLLVSNLSSPAKEFLKKHVFETNLNFAKINSLYKKYVLDIKEKTGSSTSLVSGNSLLEYTNVTLYEGAAHLTVDEVYNVKMLESGLVVFIGEKEPYGSSVVVQQSNGIDVIYGGVTTTDIKVYDYIEKGTIIGTANNNLYLLFQKEGEVLDYEPYIK